MTNFVECNECGFTLLADGGETPEPKRVDVCPECECGEFAFPSSSER